MAASHLNSEFANRKLNGEFTNCIRSFKIHNLGNYYFLMLFCFCFLINLSRDVCLLIRSVNTSRQICYSRRWNAHSIIVNRYFRQQITIRLFTVVVISLKLRSIFATDDKILSQHITPWRHGFNMVLRHKWAANCNNQHKQNVLENLNSITIHDIKPTFFFLIGELTMFTIMCIRFLCLYPCLKLQPLLAIFLSIINIWLYYYHLNSSCIL